MQTIIITIRGPARSVDLKVPAEVPIGAIMPKLVELCGPLMARASWNQLSRWYLLPANNPAPLNPSSSLLEAGVVDGAVLLLMDVDSITQMRYQEQAQVFRPRTLQPSEGTGGIGVRWNLPGR